MAASGTVQEFDIIVSDQQLDFDVSAKITTLGWDGVSPAFVRITVTETGAIGSSSTSTASLIVDDMPAGSSVKVFNHGLICGRGGNGGRGGSEGNAPTAGGTGGPAISVTGTTNAAVEIQNFPTGRIGGGGGGGGGGGRHSNSATPATWGSCGGGGAGVPVGDGGIPFWFSATPEKDTFVDRDGYEDTWMFKGNPGRFPYGGCFGAADSSGRRGGRGGHVGQAGESGMTAALDSGAAGGAAGATMVDPGSKVTLINAGSVWDGGNVPSISTWSMAAMSCFADSTTYVSPGSVDAVSGIHEDMWVECATRTGSRFWKQVKNLVPGDLLWTVSPATWYANRYFAKDVPGTLSGSAEYNLYGHELNVENASNLKGFGLAEVGSVTTVTPTGGQKALHITFSSGSVVKLLNAKMFVPNVYPSNPSIYDGIWKRTDDFPDYRLRYYNRIIQTFPLDPISSSGTSMNSAVLVTPEAGKYKKIILRRLTVPAGSLGDRAGDIVTVGGANNPAGNAICWVH